MPINTSRHYTALYPPPNRPSRLQSRSRSPPCFVIGFVTELAGYRASLRIKGIDRCRLRNNRRLCAQADLNLCRLASCTTRGTTIRTRIYQNIYPQTTVIAANPSVNVTLLGPSSQMGSNKASPPKSGSESGSMRKICLVEASTPLDMMSSVAAVTFPSLLRNWRLLIYRSASADRRSPPHNRPHHSTAQLEI